MALTKMVASRRGALRGIQHGRHDAAGADSLGMQPRQRMGGKSNMVGKSTRNGDEGATWARNDGSQTGTMWQPVRGWLEPAVQGQGGQGEAMRERRSTYGDLRIRLQWERSEARLLFVGRREGDGILRSNAQGQLLAAGWDAGNGLQTRLEMGEGPCRGDAPLRSGVGRRDEERHIGRALQRHDGSGRL